MKPVKYVIGIDISTQTVSAMLMGIAETEIILSSEWISKRLCSDEISRKSPVIWLSLARECINELKSSVPEASQVLAIGISTTFPGIFTIQHDGSINPNHVSLYDNIYDYGLESGEFETELKAAEKETYNRIWPGSMAVGFVHLLKSAKLDLNKSAKLVPANTAFAYTLLKETGYKADFNSLVSDFTQLSICGLYNSYSAKLLPKGVQKLLDKMHPGIDFELLKKLLPSAAPAWRNIVPLNALNGVQDYFGLSSLKAVAIGAGDSALGALALMSDKDTIINVRGSSDSPIIFADNVKNTDNERETLLQFQLPSAYTSQSSPWCVCAPLLRSGKVWDWVKRLRFDEDDIDADSKLESLAIIALEKRLMSGNISHLKFNPAIGGERAPDWNPLASGSITGLLEHHEIGDIALAALEGLSLSLKKCISLMENRYDVFPTKMLLAGGPVKNKLWNWVTQEVTGKEVYITKYTEASVLGAAMIGYGSLFDGAEADESISKKLINISRFASYNDLIKPERVNMPELDRL